MVVFKNSVTQGMIPIAVASFMVLEECKTKEVVPTQTDLLVGDWKMIEMDIDGYSFSYTSPDYSILFKFKSTGDFESCQEYTAAPEYNYCPAIGKWS